MEGSAKALTLDNGLKIEVGHKIQYDSEGLFGFGIIEDILPKVGEHGWVKVQDYGWLSIAGQLEKGMLKPAQRELINVPKEIPKQATLQPPPKEIDYDQEGFD
jgi:hypothetical protein